MHEIVNEVKEREKRKKNEKNESKIHCKSIGSGTFAKIRKESASGFLKKDNSTRHACYSTICSSLGVSFLSFLSFFNDMMLYPNSQSVQNVKGRHPFLDYIL